MLDRLSKLGVKLVDRRLRERLLLAGLSQALPVDELKIDKSFVLDMLEDATTR